MVTMVSQLQVPDGVLFQDLKGEAVILNTNDGQYYGLDEVGTRMWNLLAEHGQLEPVVQVMLAEYNVPEEKLRGDLLGLAEKLLEKGLLHEAEA